MKPSATRLFGLPLILLSLLALARAVQQVQPQDNAVDFPCSGDYDVRQEGMNARTRIAYCLSSWPFEYNGGTIYALGTSEQDETTVGRIHFRREGQMLYVNRHPVSSGGMYETVRYSLTRNPWILFTYRFEIRNNGLIPAGSNAPPSVLFIHGDVYKGWRPNPLGLLLLGFDIWLALTRLQFTNSKVHFV